MATLHGFQFVKARVLHNLLGVSSMHTNARVINGLGIMLSTICILRCSIRHPCEKITGGKLSLLLAQVKLENVAHYKGERTGKVRRPARGQAKNSRTQAMDRHWGWLKQQGDAVPWTNPAAFSASVYTVSHNMPESRHPYVHLSRRAT